MARRDAAHYRRMMAESPDTTVDVSLAAAAVYASRYGVCEAEDRHSAAYRQIYHDLKARHGEVLTAAEVLEAMGAVQGEPEVLLTTDHAASSYGVPVLLIDGQAYGPGDILPSGDLAAAYVGRWSLLPGRTREDLDAVARFMAGALGSRADVAQMAGVDANTVNVWESRYDDTPRPWAQTAGGNIYLLREWEAWLRRTGRLKDR
jgi:hypothetical protein